MDWRARIGAFAGRLDQPGWAGDGYAAALGALSVLAFAPFDVLVAGVLALAVHLHNLRTLSARQAWRRGFAFGVGLFAVGTAWIWNSLYDVGGVPAPLALLLLGVMVAIMGAWIGVASALAVRLAPHGAQRLLVSFPAAWVLVEWARSWVLSGFPWLLLGTTQVERSGGHLLPVGGVFAASLFVLVLAGLVAWGMHASGQGWRRTGTLVALAALISADLGRLGDVTWTAPVGAPIEVALVQGNVEQQAKWDPRQVVPTLRLYESATRAAADADLVVWPEAAIPLLFTDYPRDFLAGLVGPDRPALVTGALLWDETADLYYNAVVAIEDDPDAPQAYAKQRLVPFGEYFPVPAVVRSWLRLMDLPYSDFTSGPPGQAPLTVAGVPLGASICYEAAFPAAIMDPLPAARLLVNVSNDAWFGDSIGPHQHFQMVRARAMEAGRPLVRATNTGITAVVGADGRVSARLPQFEPGVLRASVQPLHGATPYTRTGDWPVLILCLAMLGLAWRRNA